MLITACCIRTDRADHNVNSLIQQWVSAEGVGFLSPSVIIASLHGQKKEEKKKKPTKKQVSIIKEKLLVTIKGSFGVIRAEATPLTAAGV